MEKAVQSLSSRQVQSHEINTGRPCLHALQARIRGANPSFEEVLKSL